MDAKKPRRRTRNFEQLELNRDAQRRYRERCRERQYLMEATIEQLKSSNEELLAEIEQLKQKVAELEFINILLANSNSQY